MQMNEFIDKLGAFWIISRKLSDIQRDVIYALELTSNDDDKPKHWKHSHSWALSHIEVRIKEAKGITNSVLRKLRKEYKAHEISYR